LASVFQPLNARFVFFKFPEFVANEIVVPESTVTAVGALPEVAKLLE
jgi:hypothetical protein